MLVNIEKHDMSSHEAVSANPILSSCLFMLAICLDIDIFRLSWRVYVVFQHGISRLIDKCRVVYTFRELYLMTRTRTTSQGPLRLVVANLGRGDTSITRPANSARPLRFIASTAPSSWVTPITPPAWSATCGPSILTSSLLLRLLLECNVMPMGGHKRWSELRYVFT